MSESQFPSQNQDKFVLRLPDGMRDRIKAAAEASGRSMNAEIVSTLYEKYPPQYDKEFNDLLERAIRFAPDEVERFIKNLIGRELSEGRVTEQDIDDGLIPGVVLRPASTEPVQGKGRMTEEQIIRRMTGKKAEAGTDLPTFHEDEQPFSADGGRGSRSTNLTPRRYPTRER